MHEVSLEDQIYQLEKTVAELAGRADMERHDHQRILLLTRQLAEAEGRIELLAKKMAAAVSRLDSLEGKATDG